MGAFLYLSCSKHRGLPSPQVGFGSEGVEEVMPGLTLGIPTALCSNNSSVLPEAQKDRRCLSHDM